MASGWFKKARPKTQTAIACARPTLPAAVPASQPASQQAA